MYLVPARGEGLPRRDELVGREHLGGALDGELERARRWHDAFAEHAVHHLDVNLDLEVLGAVELGERVRVAVAK